MQLNCTKCTVKQVCMCVLVIVACLTNGCRAAVWASADKMCVNRRNGVQIWLPKNCHHSNHPVFVFIASSLIRFFYSVLHSSQKHFIEYFQHSTHYSNVCFVQNKEKKDYLFVLFIFRACAVLFCITFSYCVFFLVWDKITDHFSADTFGCSMSLNWDFVEHIMFV